MLGMHLESAAARGLEMVEKDCHGGEPGAVICGLGPSIQKPGVMRQVRNYVRRGYTVFGIKEAITYLLGKGIAVRYSASMDPGAQQVAKTPVHDGVIYCLASSCHPALFDHLLDAGAEVRVYHSACGYVRHEMAPGFVIDLTDQQKAIVAGQFELSTDDGCEFSPVCVAAKPEMAVYDALFGCADVMCGGFTVGNRALALAQYMGFRDLVMAGCDFGWRVVDGDDYYAGFVTRAPLDETFQVDDGKVDGKPWKTRPDLLGSAADIAHKIIDGQVTVLGDSLAVALAKRGRDYVDQVAQVV
jgi:hypothetical protein